MLEFSTIWTSNSSSFRGQGHIKIHKCEGLVQRVVMSKYEVNPLTKKKVVANVRVLWQFDLQGQGQLGVKVKEEYISVKVLFKGLLCPNMK